MTDAPAPQFSDHLSRAAELHGVSLNNALQEGIERVIASTLPLTRFTPRVEATLRRASEISESFDHDYVGTEHILLALMEDQGGIAGQILADVVGEALLRERLLAIISSPHYRISTSQIIGGLH